MKARGLWLDRPDNLRDRLRMRWSRYARELKELRETGVVVLRNAVAPDLCDGINEGFDVFSRDPRHPEQAVLHTGRHRRLCNLHRISEPSRNAICSPYLAGFIDEALGEPFAIYSSLYFEQSTQQDIHRDSPFFCTHPYGRYLGVWIALEDVRPDAGPLVYFPRGHRIDIDPLSHATAENPVASYCADLSKRCVEAGLVEELAIVSKGDVVVWHPELPHGGSAIKSPGVSRRSMVFHVAPNFTPVHGPDVFFGSRKDAAQRDDRYIEAGKGRLMFEGGQPFFDLNG